MDDAYNQLKIELNRTAVISDYFKTELLAWAREIMREAYRRGLEEGKAEAKKDLK